MNKTNSLTAVVLTATLTAGCSSQQMSDIGLNSTAVNRYAENMTYTQLCEVAVGNRPTNQTLVAIQAEMLKRRVSLEQCQQWLTRWYLSQWLATKSEPDVETDVPTPTPLPAQGL